MNRVKSCEIKFCMGKIATKAVNRPAHLSAGIGGSYYILFLPGAGWDRPNAERWLKNQVPGRCDGALKLFHSVSGNIPRIINAIWLAANNTSHLNAASVKP